MLSLQSNASVFQAAIAGSKTFSVTVDSPLQGGDVYLFFMGQTDGGTNLVAKWDGDLISGLSGSVESHDTAICGNGSKDAVFGYLKVPSGDYDVAKNLKFQWDDGNFKSISGYAVIEGVDTIASETAWTDPATLVTMPYTETPTLVPNEWLLATVFYPFENGGVIAPTPNSLCNTWDDGMNSSNQMGYCERGDTLSFDCGDATEYLGRISWIIKPFGPAGASPIWY